MTAQAGAGEERAPSQSVSEDHRRDVNEDADDLLPLVEHKRLVEGKYGPCLWVALLRLDTVGKSCLFGGRGVG